MSNLSRLEAVSSSLDAAINKANALPDAGSGGGSSLETCTVTILVDPLRYRFDRIGYITVDDNGNILVNTIAQSTKSITIENVVCGSMLVGMKYPDLFLTTTGAELLYNNTLYGCIFSITASAGGSAYITFSNS